MCRLEVFDRRAGYCCRKRCSMSQWKRNNQNTRFWEVIPAKTLVDKWLDSVDVFLLKVVFSHVKCLNRLTHSKGFGRFHAPQLVHKGFDALTIHSFIILPTGACWGFWYDQGEVVVSGALLTRATPYATAFGTVSDLCTVLQIVFFLIRLEGIEKKIPWLHWKRHSKSGQIPTGKRGDETIHFVQKWHHWVEGIIFSNTTHNCG